MTIFLGAGMSIRTAWDKIALEYKMMLEQGRRRKRYVYEEMYETSCQMKGECRRARHLRSLDGGAGFSLI